MEVAVEGVLGVQEGDVLIDYRCISDSIDWPKIMK